MTQGKSAFDRNQVLPNVIMIVITVATTSDRENWENSTKS